MAEPQFDEINTATRKDILPSLVDNFFKNGPVVRYCKEKRMRPFKGGTNIQENFLYKPMKGGAYARGGKFNVDRRQTKTGLQFGMKTYYVNVSEHIEDIEIEARTPEAVFDMVRVDLANAALTLSAILEIAIWKHGQTTGMTTARPLDINGFEEALVGKTSGAVDASWEGETFNTYGGQSRVDGTVGTALDSPTGLIPANVNGSITNRVLEHSYQSCVIGEDHPVIGVTSNRCMGYINENYAGMQRLQDTVEPVIGWPGIKFKQATILESQYFPSQDGANDPDLGNYLTSATTGELFAWLNPGGEGDDAYFRLHVSASPKFQFGFTGFKVAQDSTMVAGQILAGLNFSVRASRLMRILYGIKG
jgi:hypothetical protein